MGVMPAKDAAKAVKSKMGDDLRQRSFAAVWMEGLHIPDGTFDEFVTECERLGMVVHSYWPCETAVISGR